jgi:hypothetical protein
MNTRKVIRKILVEDEAPEIERKGILYDDKETVWWPVDKLGRPHHIEVDHDPGVLNLTLFEYPDTHLQLRITSVYRQFEEHAGRPIYDYYDKAIRKAVAEANLDLADEVYIEGVEDAYDINMSVARWKLFRQRGVDLTAHMRYRLGP